MRPSPDSEADPTPEEAGTHREPAREPLPEAPARFAVVRAAVERLLPWVSLITSIVGAAMMERTEDEGVWVAAAAASSWLCFVLVSVTHRRRPTPTPNELPGRLRKYRKLFQFGSTAAGQSLIQLPLFFSAPFYVEACAFTPLQCLFLLLFAVVTAISSWDPWCTRALLSPVLGPALLTFASFVGFNAALPMLGVPHKNAAWITALAVGAGIPAMHLATGAVGRQRLSAICVGLALPLALVLGGMRAVPPAPLRVVSAAIGTNVVDRVLSDPTTSLPHSPGTLVCWTAIRAPHGLKDTLFHVWRLNGVEFYRLELRVQGGRQAGFRTWSRSFLPRDKRGLVQCSVETSLGQSLGGARLSLGS
jgi:hypothetical protein